MLIAGLGGLGCAAAPYGGGRRRPSGTGGFRHRLALQPAAPDPAPRRSHRPEQSRLRRQELSAINPHIRIDAIDGRLEDEAVAAEIAACDLVLDCTDNVAARDALNRLCHAQQRPLVSGAAIRMEGQLSVFSYQPGEPCYRCLSRLFGDSALTCVEAGVMAPLVGTIGTLQAMEAIKLLADYGQPLRGKLLMFDAMSMQFREMKLPKDPHCEVCGGE